MIKHHVRPMWASPQTARWALSCKDYKPQEKPEFKFEGGSQGRLSVRGESQGRLKTVHCQRSTLGHRWGEGSEGLKLCIKDPEALSKQAPGRAKAPLCRGSPLLLLFTCGVQGDAEGPR